jgi:hypothetical protein
VINTKENSKIIRNKDMEYIPGYADTSIKGTIKIMCGVAMERCTGKMAAFTKATGNLMIKTGMDNFLMAPKN